MHTGFIGLGNLGKPIARRLISQGEHLTVWNRTLGKAKGLECAVAANARQVAEQTDVLLLNLFDSAAVREVLTGKDGLLQTDIAGKTIIDTTTNHFRDVTEFHRMIGNAGGYYLEAPLLGSIVPAAQGALVMLVSGEQQVLDLVTPLLRKFCKAIYMMGGPGIATRMKLVNNLVLGGFMAVLAEAVALGEVAGIERGRVLDVLANGAGSSLLLNAKKEKLLALDFSPQFSVAAIEKDLKYIRDLASETGSRVAIGAPVAHLFHEARERGLHDEDFAAVYRVMHRTETGARKD